MSSFVGHSNTCVHTHTFTGIHTHNTSVHPCIHTHIYTHVCTLVCTHTEAGTHSYRYTQMTAHSSQQSGIIEEDG